MIYEELCLEQADIIFKLTAQNRRLILLLAQYIDVTAEDKRLCELERKANANGPASTSAPAERDRRPDLC